MFFFGRGGGANTLCSVLFYVVLVDLKVTNLVDNCSGPLPS